MDLDLTVAQRELGEKIQAGVAERLGGEPPDQPFSRDRWRAAGQLGLLGLCVPAEYGGLGLGTLDTALALEAFGRACPDMGLVFAVSAHLLACAVPIRDFAAAEVRAELLPRLVRGDQVAANAATEDEAGSDVTAMRAWAERTADGYLLHGNKSFVSNGPVADLLVTFAVTDPAAAHLGVTAFAVPAGSAGLTVTGPLAKLGLAGCPAGRVRFDGCPVPGRYRLGGEGQGAAVFRHAMAWERACLPAGYLGMLDRQLEQCVGHATGRRQFGRRLAGFQAVSHRIAGMAQRLEAARWLLYRACWLLDRGGDHAKAVALAKLAVSEAAVANSLDAVQLHGGRGYLTADGVERYLRDSVPATVFSGTSEIQRELVARELGL